MSAQRETTGLAWGTTPSNVQWPKPQSAYVHVPFCAHRCGYCDFATVAGQDERIDAYLTALDAEMQAVLNKPKRMRTLFIGGGTPTYLSAGQLSTLLGRVVHWLRPETDCEFTVECNPETLDAEKVGVLADHGVNRVSLGAQSFQTDLLARLERGHDPASVPRAVETVRRRIENVSLDLIFGVPGQTQEQWDADLDMLLSLEPDHCSTYGLTYEKGTRLWKQRRQGIIEPLDEELERRLYETAIDRLLAAGWSHYEISNFARIASRVCEHNLVYWANEACYGFGTGAAAYVSGTRTLNTRELNAYITRCLEGRSPVTQSETLEAEARARETAMLNLRRTVGVDRRRFEEQTGFSIDALAGAALGEYAAMGLVHADGSAVRLTRAGLILADSVIAEICF